MATAIIVSAVPKLASADGEVHEVKLEAVGQGTMSFAGTDVQTTDEAGVVADFEAGETVLVDVVPEEGAYPSGLKFWIEDGSAPDDDGTTYVELEGDATDGGRVSFTMPDADVHGYVNFIVADVELGAEGDVSDNQQVLADAVGVEDRAPNVLESISMLFGGDPDLSTMRPTNRFLQLVRTYVLPYDYPEDMTFDDLMLGMDNDYTDQVLTSTRSVVELYMSEDESDPYLYAYIGDELSSMGEKPFMWQFARATSLGESVGADEGFSFDPETNIVRVPRDMVDDGTVGDVQGFTLQTAQVLEGGTDDAGEATVQVNLVSERFGVPVVADTLTVTAPVFKNAICFPVVEPGLAHDLTTDDFTVAFNDVGLYTDVSDVNYFDPTTGELALAVSPATYPSITVTLKAASPVESVINFLLAPTRAFADDIYKSVGEGNYGGHGDATQMLTISDKSVTAQSVTNEELENALKNHTLFTYCARTEYITGNYQQSPEYRSADKYKDRLYADMMPTTSNWLAAEIWGRKGNGQDVSRDLAGLVANHGQGLDGSGSGWSGPWTLAAQSGRRYISGPYDEPSTIQGIFDLPGSNNAIEGHAPTTGGPKNHNGVSLKNDVRDVDGQLHIFINGVDWTSLGNNGKDPNVSTFALGGVCTHIGASSENPSGYQDQRLADAGVDWPGLNGATMANENGIVNFRVLYYDNDVVVLGFVTKAIGTQNTTAVYAFQRGAQGTIVHFQKVAKDTYQGVYNGVDANGEPMNPEYKFAGAKIKVYVDQDQSVSNKPYGQPDRNHAVIADDGSLGPESDALVFMTDADGEIVLTGDGEPVTMHLYCAKDMPGDYSIPTFNGYYVVEEVETPDGFLFPRDDEGNRVYPRFRVTKTSGDENGEEFDLVDDPVQVRIHAYKADTTMLGADGSVQLSQGEDGSYPAAQGAKKISGAKFTMKFSDGNGDERQYTGESDEYGLIVFTDESGMEAQLPLGEFWIYEGESPDGYLPPDASLVAHGKVTAEDLTHYYEEGGTNIDLGDLVFDPAGNWNWVQEPHMDWDDGATAEGFDPDTLFIRENVRGWDLSLDKFYCEADGQYHESEEKTHLANVAFGIYRKASEDDTEGELLGYVVTGEDGYVSTGDGPNLEHPGQGTYKLLDRNGDEFPKDDNGYTYIWYGDGHRWDETAQAGDSDWRSNVHGAIPYAEWGYYIREIDDVPEKLASLGVVAPPLDAQLPGPIYLSPEEEVDGLTIHYTVSNEAVVRLGFQKRDAVTGELVPAAGFTFELWQDVDGDGKLNPDVDTIVAHDEDGTHLVDDQTRWTTGNDGTVVISQPAREGKYLVREVETPNKAPYLLATDDEAVLFEFKLDKRPEAVYSVIAEFADEAAYGHVKGVKVDALDESMPLEGAQFKVRAAEDINAGDAVGTVLVSEGTFVQAPDGGDLTFTSKADGTFACHEEGAEPERGCLPIDADDGTSSYELVEVRGADGHVNIGQPAAGIPFEVSYAGDKTPDVWADVGNVPNQPTDLVIRKTADKSAVTDPDKLLPGATYALWDKADEVARADADSIDPDGRAQVNVVLQPDGNAPVGLRHHVGGSSVVQSTIDSKGYIALDPVIAGGSSYTVRGGTYANVEPGIYDVTVYGVAVDSETAGEGVGDAGTVKGVTLVAGNVYSLGLDAENKAEVRPCGVDSLPVIGLDPVPDHPSTYYTFADPDVYDVLISGQVADENHSLTLGTSDVTYFTGEGTMLNGSYVEGLLTAQTPIHTAVTGDGTDGTELGVCHFRRLGYWDREVTYKLAEVEAPKGYITDHKSYPVTFDTQNRPEGQASGTLTVTRIDMPTPTYISKKDLATTGEVPGATLRVLDRDGNVIEEWVSGTEPHYIEALEPGEYYLEEVIPPRTHEQAERVLFEVRDDGSTNKATMYDEEIEINALIDKRQEIANPIDADTEANGDNANQADTQVNTDGLYDYSLDYMNDSNTWVDEFTVTDDLDMASEGTAQLTGITTAQGHEDWDGKMNVWYKTNMDDLAIETGTATEPTDAPNATKDGHELDNPWLTNSDVNADVLELLGDDLRATDYTGWHLWKADVPTDVATDLTVDSLGLRSGEYITAFRLEYGRVEAGFTTRTDRWDDASIKDSHDDLDAIGEFNEGTFATDERSEVPYAPTKVHMQANDMYLPGTRIDNSAHVDAYRNGGNLEKLEGHDDDAVTQVPKGGDIEITGQLDKRQEIADPTAENVVENGDGKNRANVTVSEDGTYQYSLDFRNTSPTWVDEFTVTDELDAVKAGMATLDQVTTPMAAEDFDGYMNVWYQTDKSVSEPVDSDADQTLDDLHVNPGCVRQLPYDGWRLWKDMVSVDDPVTLKVSELRLAEGEKVTGVRFEFGRVEEGFTSRPNEDSWTREDLKDVHDDLDDVLAAGDEGYAPAVLQMKVTKDYVQGKPLDNSAVLDLYRTVGGSVISAHDSDAVTQTPKTTTVPPTSQTPAAGVPSELLQTGFPALVTALLGAGCVSGSVYLLRASRADGKGAKRRDRAA